MFGDYQVTLDGLRKQCEQLEALTQRSPTEKFPPTQHVPRVSDGITGARAIKLGVDSDIAIFDLNEDVFYYRQTDANGNELPMKVGYYTLKDPPKSDSDYVTVKDFEMLKAEIIGLLQAKVENMNNEEAAE